MHAGNGHDYPAWAEDFLGSGITNDNYKPVAMKMVGERVLIICMGRNGDIIAASIVVNMLIKKGFKVDWLTIRNYVELVGAVCPKASVLVWPNASPDGLWAQASVDEISLQYPYYTHYINLQLGSPENHDAYIASKMHPLEFLSRKASSSPGILMWKEYTNYLEYDERIVVDFDKPSKPLCIIAPEAITSNAMSEELVAQLVSKYSEEYDIKIVCSQRPSGVSFRQSKQKYIYGQKFFELIKILMHASLFIGNDSGLAWAALYNKKCKKIIYHNAKRYQLTNNKYSAIDPNAEDIII
jgi:hypothetical protein